MTRSGAAFLALRIFVTLLMLTGIAIAPRAARADRVYDIVNYPSLQSGDTVSGTITTDGVTGTDLPVTNFFGPSHIIDWNVTLSDSNGPIVSFTRSDSDFSGTTFSATPTELIINPADYDSLSFQILLGINPNFVSFGWYGEGSFVDYSYGTFFGPYWATGVSGPFIVATAVPEPSTGLLAGIGAVALVVSGWSRHRRARGQATN
jgi:hypothetical protein